MYTDSSTGATQNPKTSPAFCKFSALAATAAAYSEADRLPPIDFGQSLHWKAIAAANRRIDDRREAERQREALVSMGAD